MVVVAAAAADLHHGEERRRKVAEKLGAFFAEEVGAQYGVYGRDDEQDDEGVGHGHNTRQER